MELDEIEGLAEIINAPLLEDVRIGLETLQILSQFDRRRVLILLDEKYKWGGDWRYSAFLTKKLVYKNSFLTIYVATNKSENIDEIIKPKYEYLYNETVWRGHTII